MSGIIEFEIQRLIKDGVSTHAIEFEIRRLIKDGVSTHESVAYSARQIMELRGMVNDLIASQPSYPSLTELIAKIPK